MPPLLSPKWFLLAGGACLLLSLAGLAAVPFGSLPPYGSLYDRAAIFGGFAIAAAFAFTCRPRPVRIASALAFLVFYGAYVTWFFVGPGAHSFLAWISLPEAIIFLVKTVMLSSLWGAAMAGMIHPEDAKALQSRRSAARIYLIVFIVGGVLRVIQTIGIGSSLMYVMDSMKDKPAAAVAFALAQFAALLDMILPFIAAVLAFRKGAPDEDPVKRSRRIHLLCLSTTGMLAATGLLYFLSGLLGSSWGKSWSELCRMPSFALVGVLLALAIGRRHLEDYENLRQKPEPAPVNQ